MKTIHIIIVVLSTVAGLVFTGALLLFYIFPVSRQVAIPEATLFEKAEELDEVKAFVTKYPDSHDGIDQSQVPYLVVFVALKSDFEGVPRADAPFGQPVIRLIAEVDADTVARNATIYCFYGRNDTSGEQTRYQISKEKIVRFLNELEDAQCWDLPPPTYSEPIRTVVRNLNNATNID
jgi:hypothetical protein